jgi:hypothetical protein
MIDAEHNSKLIVRTKLHTAWSMLTGKPFHWSNLGQIVTHALPGLNGAVVAGGAVRRSLLDHPAGKDLDVFFENAQAASDFTAALKKAKFKLIDNTTRRQKYKKGEVVVDCVLAQYFETPKDVLADFDFTCCCFATDGEYLWYHPAGLLHGALKKLVVNNEKKLPYALDHAERYMREGFTASNQVLDALLEHGKEERAEMKPAYSGRDRDDDKVIDFTKATRSL